MEEKLWLRLSEVFNQYQTTYNEIIFQIMFKKLSPTIVDGIVYLNNKELKPLFKTKTRLKKNFLFKLNVDDITIWNGCRWNINKHTFTIEKLTEKIIDEDMLGILIVFFESKGIEIDQFNVEYMGCLTGIIYGSKNELVDTINEFIISSL